MFTPQIHFIRQNFEEIYPQRYGYAGKHGGVNTVSVNHPVHRGTVASKFSGKPTGRKVLPVELFLYDLSYVYHLAKHQV